MPGRWITRIRRHRSAIGLIAAYALLIGSLLPAFATVADPLQAYLGEHLCGPGDASKSGGTPAAPLEHQQKCQLCGPVCSMAGHAPAATLANGLIAATPCGAAAAAPYRLDTEAHSPLSRYPSDARSQGPPQAA
jgi:hypothetical protein